MIHLALSQKDILLVIRRHIQNYNQVQPTKTFKRPGKDKNNIDFIQDVTIKERKISPSVADFGAFILRKYILFYSQILANPFLRENYQSDAYPALYCNSQALAKERGCCAKTVFNHIKLLMRPEIGLITKKVFHGTHKDYELHFNPKFLYPRQEPEFAGYFEILKKSKIALPEDPQRKNLPLISTLEPIPNYVEIDITTVEKSGMSVLPDGENPPTAGTLFYQSPGPQPRRYSPVVSRQAGPTAALRTPGGAAAPNGPKTPQKVKEAHLGYIETFWLYAKALLYPGQTFAETEVRAAKNAIYAGVYLKFSADWSDKKWDEFQKRLLKRVDLAAGYIRQHPGTYIPKPYSLAINGKGYFDKENKTGFIRTHSWLVKLEQKTKADAIIKTAIAEITKFYRKDPSGSFLETKSKSENEDKNLLQIFQKYHHQLKPFGPDVLERYAQRCRLIVHARTVQAWKYASFNS